MSKEIALANKIRGRGKLDWEAKLRTIRVEPQLVSEQWLQFVGNSKQ